MLRKSRLYTIYTREHGTNRWQRQSDYSYPKDVAIRVFQNRLLNGVLSCEPREYRLRPVAKIEPKEAK